MPHLSLAQIAAYLRLVPGMARSLLQLPLRVILVSIEWVAAEVLARLVVLPYLFALHVRRHAIEARLNAERRAQLARARRAALPAEAEATARFAHFAQTLAAIHEADRLYARQDAIHPRAAEATDAAFETAMRLLRETATDVETQRLIGERVADLFSAQPHVA